MKSRELREASPDTLPGSFSDDLVTSKQWLCNYLKLLQNNTKFNIITALGSWYGNLGLFLDQNNIKFSKLILVDINPDNLAITKTSLGNISPYKIFCLERDANDHVYSKEQNQLIINTSCNDMQLDGWLDRIPVGSLVALQGRNSVQSVPVSTNDIYEFDEVFPLSKTLVLKQRTLQDPTTIYHRFMKIGIK